MRRFAFELLILAFLSVLSSSISAREIALSLRQFDHTAWSQREGAPSQIFALAQTTDGFLWLGTANGLFRFDGVTFELYQPQAGQHLPKSSVQSLLATADGGLWIGYTLGGTSLLKNGLLQTHQLQINGHYGTVWHLAVDADGSVWAASTMGLAHFVAGAWRGISKESGFTAPSAYRVFFDPDRTLWIVTDHFLYKKRAGSEHFEGTDLETGSNSTFELGADGTVYLTDPHGALSLDDLAKKPPQRRYLISDQELVELRLDDWGALWGVSSQTGVERAERLTDPGSPVEHATSLTSNRAAASLKDREGTIWIATAAGLDRFRPFALNPAPLPETYGHFALAPDSGGAILVGTEGDGLNRLRDGHVTKVSSVTIDRITCLLRAPDGRLWIGGQPALGYLDNDRFVKIPLPEAIAASNGDTQTMAIDRDGALWVQNLNNRPVMRWYRGEWSTMQNSLASKDSAFTLTTDHLGRVWSGHMGGIIDIYDGSNVSRLTDKDWAGVGNVTALYRSGKAMWIGGETGLGVFEGGQAHRALFAGTGTVHGISGIYRLEDGSLWLNSLPGIVQIAPAEVTRLLEDPGHPVTYRLFNNLDGLIGKAPQLRPFPSIVRGSDGLLWFNTTNGVVSIDPRNIALNQVVPPVAVTAVLANGTPLDWTSSATLPTGSQNLELHYTALSMAIPERVHFRYQLKGFDKDWQDAGNRRQAYYPHLPPGRYEFHVIASNNDGVWNETGALLPVTLPPTFLQSLYFKVLVSALILALLWGIYLWRLRLATDSVRARLFERFSERERIARDLHDTFFQGIQGLLLSVQSAARRLPAGDTVRASLEHTLTQSDEVMHEGRRMVLDLRTQATEIHELGAALQAYAQAAGQEASVGFELQVVGNARPLNSLVSEELYKIGCEAVINALRHAEATQVDVQISYGRLDFRMRIQDNGRGIAPAILDRGGIDHHFGLPGMKERAKKIGGDLVVRNRAEGGVEVNVRISSRLAYRGARR